MIEHQQLDVRTITMGISLLDCCDGDVEKVCEKIYAKITGKAKNLVSVGEEIEREFGIPIVNKRISVTPIALIGAGCCKTTDDSPVKLLARACFGKAKDNNAHVSNQVLCMNR